MELCYLLELVLVRIIPLIVPQRRQREDIGHYVCQINLIKVSSICCFVGFVPYVDHTSRLASSAVYVLTISFRFADAFMFIIVAMSM